MTLAKRTDDTAPRPAKLTASDFWLLADSGAFANHARTELIEGEIWAVHSVHRWHARTLAALHLSLARAIEATGLALEVLIAGSVSMSDDSVPEPDLSVIAPEHADADTIALHELKIAIEISDSTADFDLGRKARLYARHGVPDIGWCTATAAPSSRCGRRGTAVIRSGGKSGSAILWKRSRSES